MGKTIAVIPRVVGSALTLVGSGGMQHCVCYNAYSAENVIVDLPVLKIIRRSDRQRRLLT